MLFSDVPEGDLATLLDQHFGLNLGTRIKASQNHTYQAALKADPLKLYSVRVTPYTEQSSKRVRSQVSFLIELSSNGFVQLCPVLATKDGKPLVQTASVIIVVFEWARGNPVDFMALEWMKDPQQIKACGRFLARLHLASIYVQNQKGELCKQVQDWSQIHHGILKDYPLTQQDKLAAKDPNAYGVIHGDFNPSNYFFDKESGLVSVYDTDQLQRGFFEWELAQPLFGPIMLLGAGKPLSGDPMQGIQYEPFKEALIHAYEQERGAGSVNRPRLQRMIVMKTQFYRLFCVRAKQQGNMPPEMQAFINYILKWLEKK